MRKESRLSTVCNFFASLAGPDLDSSSRTAPSVCIIWPGLMLELSGEPECLVLVWIDVQKAQISIGRGTCGEECKVQLHAREYCGFVMPMVVTVIIQIVNQFAWFSVDVEGKGVILIPR